MDQQIIFFITLVLILAGFGVLGWLIFDLKKRVRILSGGEETKDGNLIPELLRRISRAETKLEEAEPRLALVEEISKISVQKVGFLRFNPFDDTGGDNSFVLTLLDRENNGVLLTSLYLREGMRLYAKRVEGGETKQQLSEEESRVLNKALEK